MTDVAKIPGAVAEPTQPGRQRALGILAALAFLLVLGMAADLLAAAAPAPPPQPVVQPAATAGSWYCPAVAQEGEQARLTIAAVGEQPSSVIVDRYSTGRAVADEVREVAPGTAVVVDLEGEDAAAASAVRWTGGPAVATWSVVGDSTAAAPCEPAPADRWHLVGFNTSRGLRSTLHLFNPFTADAVVRLVFATPDGEVRLVLADNILVGAGGTTSVNLRKFQPEVTDLGVTVEVLSGRVVAQGEQTIVPPPRTSGASGRLLVAGAPEPRESWYFAFAADGDDTESWLTVLNPGDEVAAVEVRVSNPTGEASSLLAEISVPAGGVARIELTGASKDPVFGVAVTVVNGQPVAVTRSTSLAIGARSGISGGLGAPALSTTWALVGAGTAPEQTLISLYNPGAQTATVSVAAAGAPDEWQSVVLPPNGREALNLADAGADRASGPVVVSGDVPIVAELRAVASAGNRLRLWLGGGVPRAAWVGRPTRPPVQRDPSLSTSPQVGPSPDQDRLDELDDVPTDAVEDPS